MMKKQINVPIAVIIALIVAAGGFLGGMQYQKMQRGNFMMAGNGQGRMMMGQRVGGQLGENRMMQTFRPTNGEIISTDGNSITVKTDDGSSKIVMLGDSTKINEAKEASRSALFVGQKVAVFGNEKEGMVTAESIQINPMTMMIRRP